MSKRGSVNIKPGVEVNVTYVDPEKYKEVNKSLLESFTVEEEPMEKVGGGINNPSVKSESE